MKELPTWFTGFATAALTVWLLGADLFGVLGLLAIVSGLVMGGMSIRRLS